MGDPPRKWFCEQCEKLFLSDSSYKRHQKRHDEKSKRKVPGLPHRRNKGPVPDEKRQKPHTRSAGPPLDLQFYLRKSREKSTESTATSPVEKLAIGLAEDPSGRVPDDRTPTCHQFFPLPDQKDEDRKAGGEGS